MQQEAGEGKARKKKSTRNPDHWYARNAQDFHDGTRELNLEQRAVYNDVIDLIYIFGGALTMSDRLIASKLVIHVNKWTALKQQLIDAGKLFLTPEGHLHNERAAEVLAERQAERDRRATSARPRPGVGSPTPSTRPRLGRGLPRQSEKNTNKNNAPAEHMPTELESSSDPEREERSSSMLRLIDDDDRASTDPPQRKISKAVETALCNREGQERGAAIIAEYLGSDYAKNARVIDRAFVGWLKKTYGFDISVRGTTAPMAEIFAMCGPDRNGRPDLTLPKKIRGRP